LEERRSLDGVYDVFSQTKSAVGEHHAVTEAFRNIQRRRWNFWRGIAFCCELLLAAMSYIVEPPLTERRMFDAGDELSFSVVLIGKSTVYWNLLIYAVKKLGETHGIGRRVDGRRGKFQLKRVDSVDRDDSSVTVYSEEHEFQHDKPVTLTSELGCFSD